MEIVDFCRITSIRCRTVREAKPLIIIENYSRCLAFDGYFKVVSSENCVCPCCKGALCVRDSRKRKVITQTGNVDIYRLRRLKCRRCGKLHTELPGCIAPYKHYAIDVIESELLNMRKDCPAENRTSQRWKCIFVSLLASVKYLLQFPKAHWPSTLMKIFYGKNQYAHPLCLSLWNMRCYNSC